MIKFIAVKTTWTESMKDFATETLKKKVERYNADMSEILCEIKVTNLGTSYKVDINYDGKFIVQSVKADFYVALTDATNKLKKLIYKLDKKKISKVRARTSKVDDTNFIELEEVCKIAKEKIFVLSPETLDEVYAKFERTDYSFYVFRNVDESNEVSILYRRKDNSIGLIRCR